MPKSDYNLRSRGKYSPYIFTNGETIRDDMKDILIKLNKDKRQVKLCIRYIELGVICMEKDTNMFSCLQLKKYVNSVISGFTHTKFFENVLIDFKERICRYEDIQNRNQEEVNSDVKVYVFDLDNTLYLHDHTNKDYFNEYRLNLVKFLEKLTTENITLCIATHNKTPITFLDELNITNLFKHIIYEKKNVHPYLNTIKDYTPKSEMMKEIMTLTSCTYDKMIFFDDDMFNIRDVETLNIKSVLVCSKVGITFNKIMYRKLKNIV